LHSIYVSITQCDILQFPVARGKINYPCSMYGARDQKEETSMNKYELAIVLNAKIDDETRLATLEKAKAYVERFGGEITSVDEWGKKRLAYEIQKMKEGYYYFIHFTSPSTAPAELENRLRIMENVLRYLCLKDEA